MHRFGPIWIGLTLAVYSQNCAALPHADHNVVNFQNHIHSLSGQRNRRGVDQQRLEDVDIKNVGHLAGHNVDARCLLSLGMPVAQFCHNSNGIQASIFGECVGDDLESVCVCLDAVAVRSAKGFGPSRELKRELNFWCSPTSDEVAL